MKEPRVTNRWCEICDTVTKHTEICIRDANIPPDEDTCTQEDITFYMNGDSVYEYTCLECGYSEKEI